MMKKLLLTALSVVFSLSMAKDIYVTKSGNDGNAGTQSSPYLTISKAASVAVAGDNVYIGEGTYEETLTPANSGTNGNPITYQSVPGEKVIISAMEALSGWTSDGGDVYKTTTSWDLGQRNFVMRGTTALDLARWPNNNDGDRFTLNSLRNDGGSQDEVTINAFLTDTEIPNWNWSNGGSIMFYGDRPGSGWTTWKAWIKGQSQGRVDFDAVKDQSWIISFHPPGDKGDYYLEGIKEALDYENEWYFDASNKTLYVILPNGEAPVDGEMAMARRELAVNLNNKNYITIKNLAVFGGGINIKGTGNTLYGLTSLYGSMTRGVTPKFNSGVNAVNVDWNAVNTTIEKCEIGFGDGTGVWDSGSGTTIKNCYVHDFDMLGSYDAPLMVRGQNNAKVLNNTVTRGGRDGLQIISKGSEVAYNDFSHSNMIADDCALLYTIGADLNMDIHHNWFHDATGRGHLKKAAGIYLDNDAGDVRVFRNVVWNVEWTNVQINWNGTNIDIFNNTLMKADGGTMGAWHKAGTQFTNVKVWNNITDKETSDQGGNQETEVTWEPQSDKQNNLIDKTSFVDHTGNDFRLTPNSIAVDYGRQITGYTDGFVGNAPDVGAYELGDDWVPGIDWEKTAGANGVCYGLPGESCSTDPGIEPIIESVALIDPPLTVEPTNTLTYNVDYAANETRDIIVEVKTSTDGWVGRSRVTVTRGEGQTTATLSLANDLAVGGYKLTSWLVPVGGDWQDILRSNNYTFDVIEPVVEDVMLVSPPTEVEQTNNLTVDFSYTTAQPRDVIVEVKNSTDQWLGNVRVNVPQGTGTSSGTINFNNPLEVATGYKLASFMVPVGEDWRSIIVSDNTLFDVILITGDGEKVSGVTIYPNPTARFVNMSTNQSYELLNEQGVTLLKGEGNSVDLSDYATGQYFLKVEGELHRIIKQ